MRRIAVIGPVASGKSTLAHLLGSRMALPVVDLDDVYFGAGRRFCDDEWRIVHRSLLTPECWIIAGDYRAVAGERFATADTIVWLDLPRLVCSWRALCRPYPASKVDCLRWIWRYPMRGRKQTIASLSGHAGAAAVFHLRSPREVRAFMTRIPAGRRIGSDDDVARRLLGESFLEAEAQRRATSSSANTMR
jgi:adenylate kinase family enzyme